jgi:hypothetical protein
MDEITLINGVLHLRSFSQEFGLEEVYSCPVGAYCDYIWDNPMEEF